MPTPYWIGHSLILSLVLLDTGGGEYRAGQGQQQHHRGAHHQAAHHTSSSTLNSIHKVRVNHSPSSWQHSSSPGNSWQDSSPTVNTWQHSSTVTHSSGSQELQQERQELAGGARSHHTSNNNNYSYKSNRPHQMYKRDSSQHTDTLSSAIINTTLSDTLHLNINTNAQTMSHDALLANEKTSASNYFYLNHPGGGGGGSSSSRGGQDMSSASQDPFLPQDQGYSAADYGYSAEDDPGYSPSPQLNQTFATTCLRQDIVSCIESDARREAKFICSSVPVNSRIRRLLYHPLYPSRCWSTPLTSHQCPPPVLNHTLVEAIQSNNSEACVSAGSWVLCQILAVNKDISQIDDVMTSGFCVGDSPGDVEGEGSCSEESSSIRCFNCHECKKWYIDWMCMSMWPLWLGGHRILPCSSLCSRVQEHCPFNIIMEDASTAGGDPTFICEDPIVINSSFVNPVHQSSSSGTQSDPSNQQQHPASLPSSFPPPQCCAQPVQLTVGSSAEGGGADGTADPPAGGYVDLNATVCLPLLREWTGGVGGGSTAYCDSGYSTAASGGLRLLNKSLTLRQIEAPAIQSNWFWNLVTLNSGGVGQWTASSRPAILTLLLAVIYFHRCQYCIEQRKDYSTRLPS